MAYCPVLSLKQIGAGRESGWIACQREYCQLWTGSNCGLKREPDSGKSGVYEEMWNEAIDFFERKCYVEDFSEGAGFASIKARMKRIEKDHGIGR